MDWVGGFGSARYNTEQLAFGVGWTSSSFTVTDHFTPYNSSTHQSSFQSSGEDSALMLTSNNLTGTQLSLGQDVLISRCEFLR